MRRHYAIMYGVEIGKSDWRSFLDPIWLLGSDDFPCVQSSPSLKMFSHTSKIILFSNKLTGKVILTLPEETWRLPEWFPGRTNGRRKVSTPGRGCSWRASHTLYGNSAVNFWEFHHTVSSVHDPVERGRQCKDYSPIVRLIDPYFDYMTESRQVLESLNEALT